MSHKIVQKTYSELRSIYQYYIDSYTALYQLKAEKEDEILTIYKMIKTNLIDSNKHHPRNVMRDILNIIPYNNRYAKSYLKLAKLISDEYHITEVSHIPIISNYLFYKEYGIELSTTVDFRTRYLKNLDIDSNDTIYRSIMYDDKERFIYFIERDGFDKDQKLDSDLYPYELEYYHVYSLLELCCYHGAVDCFKLLRTKFYSGITQRCLEFSFIGGNPEIMSECLKYEKPTDKCMVYAQISHNIDFVTYLMNEHKIEIDLDCCGEYNNLESFLVHVDKFNDIKECLRYSAIFDIPSLCEYFFSLGAIYNINVLAMAVSHNSIEVVKFLLSNYLNLSDIWLRDSALHEAIFNNSNEIVELLLSRGANINEKVKEGRTYLIEAVNRYRINIVKFILSYGANVNEKDDHGRTALYSAVEHNDIEIVQLLISQGANVNEKDDHGRTALYSAVEHNDIEIVQLLISQGANVNEKDDHGRTALYSAVEHNDIEIVQLLISQGANVNEKDDHGRTALYSAVEHNDIEIVQLLISHGANVNEKDENGRTALYSAAEHNDIEIVQLFISHGANVNEKDDYGSTALQFAVKHFEKDTVELLISHGANINEKDEAGYTALHYAVINNHQETVELLISHGVNINEKDKNEKTALNYAKDNNYEEIYNLLLSHGAYIYEKDKDEDTSPNDDKDEHFSCGAKCLI